MSDVKIDPYKILEVNKHNFTIEDLRKNFKRLALIYHTDKGGSDYMFKLLCSCYKALVKELDRRQHDKQFHELKQGFQRHEAPLPPPDTKGFSLDRFNKVFDENRVKLGTEDGYEDFLKALVPEAPNIQTKMSNDAFNKQFEKHNTMKTKEIIKYKEPEPLLITKKIAYTELGVDKLDDFSGDNTSRKNLNFMDVKVAHTTSRIVDPRSVEKRKSYKSIDDFEADRTNIQYTMSDKEQREYEKRRNQELLRERQREEKQRQIDHMYEKQYDRVHQLLIGR